MEPVIAFSDKKIGWPEVDRQARRVPLAGVSGFGCGPLPYLLSIDRARWASKARAANSSARGSPA